MENYLIASRKIWIPDMKRRLETRLNASFHLITNEAQLTLSYLDSIKPKCIFFPHWSHVIPSNVFLNYPCIIFHMTDLPFGRGGSPLQNLIVHGFDKTKISALQCAQKLDAGAVYLKKPLSLTGSAGDIYLRTNEIILNMIIEILKTNPLPRPQEGKATIFKRRNPQESSISSLSNLKELYDWIRMLDAEDYPRAFLETDAFLLTFTKANFTGGELTATVKIKKRD